MQYEIWGDNENESLWFQGLDSRLVSAKVRNIGPRGTNSEIVDSLVVYDRPDIILLADEKPILVLEKTAEVPTGHNVGQRVARLVRAAELSLLHERVRPRLSIITYSERIDWDPEVNSPQWRVVTVPIK
jgi:hypothetical protein